MPKNQFQRMVFAFLTVIVTVHAYVFYSLYVINGPVFMAVNQADSVLSAIRSQRGVSMLGFYVPIWAAILYYPYYGGFNFFILLANWLKLVCHNFPFAFFTQLFFIQPLVRTVFKLIFVRDVKVEEKGVVQA